MSSNEERDYIREKLIPELLDRMDDWAAEYKQPRELGVRGEFVGLHRKVGKLKTIVWDGVDASGWREDPRTILQEVIAHGFLMLSDMDHGDSLMSAYQPIDPATLDDAKERERRTRHLSLPLAPDHTFQSRGHLAHPGVDCKTWEEMKDDGRTGR